MGKVELFNKVTRGVHKFGFELKKHSPEILVVGGVVGVVASAVLACKATTKLNGILEDTKEDIGKIKEYVEEHGYTEKYSEEDSKKDTAIIYAQSGVKLAKLYGPALLLGTVSITAILAGHNILRTRSAALAAAYATIDKGFKEYRGRVVERFGEQLDKELKYNIRAEEVENAVVKEDGTEEVSKEIINVADINQHSDYARFFCEGCKGWTKDPEFNLMFLRRQQDSANEILKSRGYLFLNDVYEMLGIDKTQAGFVVGWIYDEKYPIGDNYVDFGIYEINDERKRAFVNGYERNILLDFNVDGNIIERM